jgi:hypothetical protein
VARAGDDDHPHAARGCLEQRGDGSCGGGIRLIYDDCLIINRDGGDFSEEFRSKGNTDPRQFCTRLNSLEYFCLTEPTIEGLVSDHDLFHLIEAD